MAFVWRAHESLLSLQNATGNLLEPRTGLWCDGSQKMSQLGEGGAGMVGGAHFVKSCPTCSRTLQIKVQYMGRRVSCGHCHARFLATESDSAHAMNDVLARAELMRRADELLGSVEESPQE